ncbi:MAG: universal stress protein [Nocardioides sp.]|uniref:universal stress protein n=1 Tax=Nocardioides sp. TaxID=35761 RepID=UPI0039E62AFC
MTAVVVGYVPKPEGAAALDRAIREAIALGDRLVVVSSVRADETQSELRELAERDLVAATARLTEGGVDFEIRRQSDDEYGAAEELAAIAEEVSAELLVIGVRRRSPTGKLILGTQAQRILLEAPCPVLVVKD